MGIFSAFRQYGIASPNFWLTIISTAMVLLLCLPIHEFAHGFVANKLGDPTAKNLGRLQLNPFSHLDLIGSIAIFLFGFGWAKPIPVNSYYFKNPKRDMALTALAGPVANFLLGTVILLVFKILALFGISSMFMAYLQYALYYMVMLNISLAVFNLLPIPPLDGSKILDMFLPDRIYDFIMQYERYAIILVYLVMFSGILDVPMRFLQNALYGLMNFLTGFVDLIAKVL